MPWWIIVALTWGLLAWIVALIVGRFFGLNDRRPAPPAHPRARLVLDRDRAGHVEIKPSTRDRV